MSHSHKFFFEHTTPFRTSDPGFHFQKFFIYVFEIFALRHSVYYIRNINYPKVLAPLLITHIYSFFILYPFLVLWNFSHSILYVTVLVFCSVISVLFLMFLMPFKNAAMVFYFCVLIFFIIAVAMYHSFHHLLFALIFLTFTFF